jgi:hypothetical protein
MQSTKILIPKNQLTDLNKEKGPNKKSVNEFTTKVKEVEMNTPDN